MLAVLSLLFGCSAREQPAAGPGEQQGAYWLRECFRRELYRIWAISANFPSAECEYGGMALNYGDVKTVPTGRLLMAAGYR